MTEFRRGIGRSAAYALFAIAFVVPGSSLFAAEEQRGQSSLWFDPTQLPSFTGVVERYLADPDGQVDRLLFKEGPQIAFPPDVFEAVSRVAPAGRPLVVWGIRARKAAVITMLAFGPPDGEATMLDRIYWRPQGSPGKSRRKLLLIGTVRSPYLSPQGEIAGAILQNGDVVRVSSSAAAALKDRFKEGAKIVAEGSGAETLYGKAVDAARIGDSVASLEPVPGLSPAPTAHAEAPRPPR